MKTDAIHNGRYKKLDSGESSILDRMVLILRRHLTTYFMKCHTYFYSRRIFVALENFSMTFIVTRCLMER
jgi:hypothetical protein